jgi:hypothetical protein
MRGCVGECARAGVSAYVRACVRAAERDRAPGRPLQICRDPSLQKMTRRAPNSEGRQWSTSDTHSYHDLAGGHARGRPFRCASHDDVPGMDAVVVDGWAPSHDRWGRRCLWPHGQRGANAHSTAGAAEVGEQDEWVQRPLQVDEASFCHCLLNRVDWTGLCRAHPMAARAFTPDCVILGSAAEVVTAAAMLCTAREVFRGQAQRARAGHWPEAAAALPDF